MAPSDKVLVGERIVDLVKEALLQLALPMIEEVGKGLSRKRIPRFAVQINTIIN